MKLSLRLTMLAYLLSTLFLIQAAPVNFIAPEQVSATSFIITSPGLYILTDDASEAFNDSAITIAADHVTLDLNGKNIQGSYKGSTGILISAGTKNIVIKNGALSGFSAQGIHVEAGAHHLSFSNITVIGPTSGAYKGFIFAGDASSPIYNVLIENCHASSCDKGIYTHHAHEVQVINSTFNCNRKIGIDANTSHNWRIVKSQASQQQGTEQAAGIVCAGGMGWSLQDSDFSSNVGAAGYGALFSADITSSKGSHEIISCSFSNNGGYASIVRGLDLLGVHSCVIKNCVCNGNHATMNAVRGLNVAGVGHYIENCIANGNHTEANAPFAATGIVITGSAHTIVECQVAGNTSKNGLGIGILNFASAERCLIKNCTAVSNSSSGFQDDSGKGANLWLGNLSWGHGVKNYVGNQGFKSLTAGEQPGAGMFDERGIDNISVL